MDGSASTKQAEAPVPGAAKVHLLFRQQAIDFQRQSAYGSVLLLRPVSHRWITLGFVLVALVLLLFFFNFSTTRKAQVQGVLLPDAGVLRVQSNQAGRLVQAAVHEGQEVRRGDTLFVLNAERSGVSSESAERIMAQLLEQQRSSYTQEMRQSGEQARQRVQALDQKVQDLQAEVAQLSAQQDLQRQRVELAEAAYRRFEELKETRFISAALLQDKQAELIDQRQRFADLQRAVLAKRAESERLLADREAIKLQAQREGEALRRSAMSVDRERTENDARLQILVRAPIDGRVTGIGVTPGQVVNANTVLASLLPSGAQLEAEVYAPSRAIGFIRPGMEVLLRYQAYPHQKFGQHRASVKEITHTSMPHSELPPNLAGVFRDDEPLYKIRLRLEQQHVKAYGKDVPLKSGMLLDASVRLDQRYLYEWAVEPLISISGRL